MAFEIILNNIRAFYRRHREDILAALIVGAILIASVGIQIGVCLFASRNIKDPAPQKGKIYDRSEN
jgi:hypothetical protein